MGGIEERVKRKAMDMVTLNEIYINTHIFYKMIHLNKEENLDIKVSSKLVVLPTYFAVIFYCTNCCKIIIIAFHAISRSSGA